MYTFGNATESREQPLTLPDGYETKARDAARGRMAVAGLRLAAVLNASLKQALFFPANGKKFGSSGTIFGFQSTEPLYKPLPKVVV